MYKSVFDRVTEFIAQYADMDKDQMSEATQLIADAGLNSLYLLELINDAEDEFGVQIDDEEIPKIVTIGDLMRLVSAKT